MRNIILENIKKFINEREEIWTPEKIEKEAQKYKTRGDFNKNSQSAYLAARRLKIMDFVTKHMGEKKTKKWDTEKFIERAKQIHGDKYDYVKSIYIGSETPLTITCPTHGDFEVKPTYHINDKIGCPKERKVFKWTTNDFIYKAQEKHGDKYDYNNVNYIDSDTPVNISCPRHGDFTQNPQSHIRGTGCPKCGAELNSKNRLSSTDKFIEKARKVHGDKYNYEETEYISTKEPVKINCVIHGQFKQTPNSHLIGSGCPECGKLITINSKRGNAEDFIKKSNKIYNNIYDYSNVNYINTSTKVAITCPEHGVFYKRPAQHLRGQGCPKCGYLTTSKKLSDNQEEFLIKARKEHGNKYDYSLVKYVKSNKPVTIICPKHGEFNQIVNGHLTGSGCPECGKESVFQARTYDTDDFIRKSKEQHGEKYDYSLVDYNVSTDLVDIKCSKHGVFSQQAGSHMRGAGCPLCQESKGEKIVSSILSNLGIEYIRQHKFNDCRGDTGKVRCRVLPFDFYIPKFNLLIEYDGKQHFMPIEKFGGEEGYKKTKRTDEIKNNYALNNNIKLIRIPYTIPKKDLELYVKKILGITS
jgi:ssDNA-binding Zn-finger/Zn-ribbon topoisomerase 1